MEEGEEIGDSNGRMVFEIVTDATDLTGAAWRCEVRVGAAGAGGGTTAGCEAAPVELLASAFTALIGPGLGVGAVVLWVRAEAATVLLLGTVLEALAKGDRSALRALPIGRGTWTAAVTGAACLVSVGRAGPALVMVLGFFATAACTYTRTEWQLGYTFVT